MAEEKEIKQQAPAKEFRPAREEIKIREFYEAEKEGCRVCGLIKEAYIEIEVEGKRQYTCKECYLASKAVVRSCKNCGSPVKEGDLFCGKCGSPTSLKCPSCKAETREGDIFCGKCGTKL